MMAKRSRIAILVASLALGLMYVLPLWTIDLEAPQYPEGLGMVIQINTIEGQKEHDLKNINGLNHYIGMREIVPESIPELVWMPKIVAALMLFGGLVALVGRRKLLYAWVVVFIGISLVGLADFYKWEYDYGHNLNEEVAIIKIPGMSYQPPLIGSRQILNFRATSWPGLGGLAAILAAIGSVTVATLEFRRGRKKGGPAVGEGAETGPEPRPAGGSARGLEAGPEEGPSNVRRGNSKPARRRARHLGNVALFIALAAVGCTERGPRPMVSGVDGCESCLMMLDSDGHAAQLVTRTGKQHTFDSVECLTNFLAHSADGDEQRSVWVTDFSNPDVLIEARNAFFLVSATLKSPMGLGITAFARQADRDGAVHSFGGDAMDWGGIQEYVSDAWPDGRPTRLHGGHTSSLSPETPS